MCPRGTNDARFLPEKPKCRHEYVLTNVAMAQEIGFIVNAAPGVKEVYVCKLCRDDGFYAVGNDTVARIKKPPKKK
jgi:hypothetical protein